MTTTVNADIYIMDLDPGTLSNTSMLPFQDVSTTPELATFKTTGLGITTFLQQTFCSKIKTIENKTTNWAVTSADSSKIFALTNSGASTIQCSISADLSIGFEFEIEDIYGYTITFVPNSASDIIKSSSAGQNYVLESSATSSIRVRKIATNRWNVVKVS